MSEKATELPLLVVLTGGIASGKTAVSDRLAALGAPVVDTDLIAREVVEPGSEGLKAVREAFGDAVIDPDGRLDRAALRRAVFEDERARRRLEGILHPRIEALARERIRRHADAPYVALVVPLLVETGLFGDADRVVVVDVPEAVQIERLMARDRTSREQAERMLKTQADRDQRLAAATDLIDNSGSPKALDEQVRRLDRELRSISARRRSRSTRRR